MIRATMLYDFLYAQGDREAYIRAIHENGANCLRFFINCLLDDNEIAPSPPIFEAAGTWTPDNIHTLPVPDLSQISPLWLVNLREVADMLRKYDIVPWIVMDDRCSKPTDGTWAQLLDPWYANSEVLVNWRNNQPQPRRWANGDEAFELGQRRKSLESAILDTFRNAGHETVYAEVENEYGWDAPEGAHYSVEKQLAWYEWRAESLRDVGFSSIIGSARPPITNLISPFINTYDQHGIESPAKIQHYPNISDDLMILNTDGAAGSGAGPSVWGYRSLSVAETVALAPYVKRGFCLIHQETFDSKTEPSNVDKADLRPLRALSEATGWTAPAPVPVPDPNPEPPIPPPTPPVPPSPPAPPKKKFPWWIVELVAVILIAAALLIIL